MGLRLRGTNVEMKMVGVESRVQPADKGSVRECVKFLVTSRPFFNTTVSFNKILEACSRGGGYHYFESLFEESVLKTIELEQNRNQSGFPTVSSDLMSDTIRFLIPFLKYQELPAWWGKLRSAGYAETFQFATAFQSEIASDTKKASAIVIISEKFGVYNRLLEREPDTISTWKLLVARFQRVVNASGADIVQAANAFEINGWLALTEEQTSKLVNEFVKLNPSQRLAVMQNPQRALNTIVEREREEQRQEFVRNRTKDFENTIAGLPKVLRDRIINERVGQTYSRFFERESRGQVSNSHLNQMKSFLAALKKISSQSVIEGFADEVYIFIRELPQSEINSARFTLFLTFADFSPSQMNQAIAVKQELKGLNFSVTIEEITRWTNERLGLEMLSFARANSQVLSNLTGVSTQTLPTFLVNFLKKTDYSLFEKFDQLIAFLTFNRRAVYVSGRTLDVLFEDFKTGNQLLVYFTYWSLFAEVQKQIDSMLGVPPDQRAQIPFRVSALQELTKSDPVRLNWSRNWGLFHADWQEMLTECKNLAECKKPYIQFIDGLVNFPAGSEPIEFGNGISAMGLIKPLLSDKSLSAKPIGRSDMRFFLFVQSFGLANSPRELKLILDHVGTEKFQIFLKQLATDRKATPAGVRLTTVQTAIDETLTVETSLLYSNEIGEESLLTQAKALFKAMRETTNKDKLAGLLNQYRELMSLK